MQLGVGAVAKAAAASSSAARRSIGSLRREQRRNRFQRLSVRKRAVQIGMIWRSPMPRPVDNINPVTLLQEIRGPAAPPIRRAHPIQTLPAAAVDQHDRIWVLHLRRDLVFHIHLFPVHYRRSASGERRALHANPEKVPLGDIERRLRRSRGAARSRGAQVGCRERSQCGQRRAGGHELAPAEVQSLLQRHGTLISDSAPPVHCRSRYSDSPIPSRDRQGAVSGFRSKQSQPPIPN